MELAGWGLSPWSVWLGRFRVLGLPFTTRLRVTSNNREREAKWMLLLLLLLLCKHGCQPANPFLFHEGTIRSWGKV